MRGGGHGAAREGVESGQFDLTDLGCDFGRSQIHRRGTGLVDEVHDKLAGAADVAGRVLGDAGLAVPGSEAEHGRLGPEEVEKAEGRGIDAARLILRRDPGDGTRRHQSGEKLVGPGEVFAAGEVKLHGGREAGAGGRNATVDHLTTPFASKAGVTIVGSLR